jgi:hypothetical protein
MSLVTPTGKEFHNEASLADVLDAAAKGEAVNGAGDSPPANATRSTAETVDELAKRVGVRPPGDPAPAYPANEAWLRLVALALNNGESKALRNALVEGGVDSAKIAALFNGTMILAELDQAERRFVHKLWPSGRQRDGVITDDQVLRARVFELTAEMRAHGGNAAAKPKSEPPKTSPPSYRPNRGESVDIQKLQYGKLLKLLRRRGLHPLPDDGPDGQSRRYLQALLDLGLPAKRVLDQVAPWIGSDLEAMLKMAIVARGQWNDRTLGDLFEVTKQEKLNYDLRNIECYDADRWEVQEALAARKRERNKGWMAQSRLKKAEHKARAVRALPPGSNVKPISEFPAGPRLVYASLDGKGSQTIHDLACALRSDSSAGRGPEGHRLKHAAIMRKIHRWVDPLVEGGLVGEEYVPFDRGPRMRRVRRFDQAD